MSTSAADLNNLPYADGDFYSFEQLLSGKEQDRLAEVRDFLAREVRPIAVDFWNRGEFPMDLIPKLADIDLVSPVRRQGHSNMFAGLMHAEVTRADASISTFMASTTGFSPVPSKRWLPRSKRTRGCLTSTRSRRSARLA
jgi:glutaryl-CoA dehydrogenase